MYLHTFFLFLYSQAISFGIGECSSIKRGSLSKKPPLPEIPEPCQSFHAIRTSKENYTFVDKTNYIKELIDNNRIKVAHKIYFLARPRTFGKTFFLSMVHEFLNGSRNLFENTAIYTRGNTIEGNGTWEENPVIHIDFAKFAMNTGRGFEKAINLELEMIARRYSACTKNEDDSTITWLIRNLESKCNSKVSILIDNFDYPLEMSHKNIQRDITDILVSFYNEIRAAAHRSQLWLVLIFGVSRLNMIHDAMNGIVRDITFEDKFSSILGFSVNEIAKNFRPHLNKLAEEKKCTTSNVLQEIVNMYGVYRFGTEKCAAVLNTGSVCSCFQTLELTYYEPKSSTLTSIIKQMIDEEKGINYFKYHCIKKKDLQQKLHYLDKNMTPLYMQMLYNGYLTIKFYCQKTKEVFLSYPNEGIQDFIEGFLPPFLKRIEKDQSHIFLLRKVALKALTDCDVQFFDNLLREAAPLKVCAWEKYGVWKDKDEYAGTSDMYIILDVLRINCERVYRLRKSENASECGYLDLIIFSSQKNMPHYVIMSTFENHPHIAIFKLFHLVAEYNDDFDWTFNGKYAGKYFENGQTEVVNLLGLSFKKDKDGLWTIDDWLLVPYDITYKKIMINRATTSKQEIVSDLSERTKQLTCFKRNKDIFIFS